MGNSDIRQIQQDLICLLPEWNYQITKPFKQILTDGVSIEMYYCLRILYHLGGNAMVSELAQFAKMPKQQTTKMVNRLADHQFITRKRDAFDHRIIRIQLTDKAVKYLERILAEDIECFAGFLNAMSEENREIFHSSIRAISKIMREIPHNVE